MTAFVSHDREDNAGVRAEVHVNTIKGTVKSIDDSNPKSAKASFTVEWLKYPVGGWISKDEEAFKLLQAAYADKSEVEVRIESKRKKGVDRTLPISDLRGTAEDAQKNTTSVVVAVDGVFTSEALTHPSEDPVTGEAKQALPVEAGARKASTSSSAVSVEQALETLTKLSTSREVAQSVIDAVAAHALISGATPEQIAEATNTTQATPTQQNGFSNEAPSFKDYNSDGRTNLGNYTITAAVGAEGFTNGLLRELNGEVQNKTVELYTQLVLAIADRIQVTAYGEGFRLDRSASSHTRIRGIVYDVIRHEYTFPVDENGGIAAAAAVNTWVQNVGKRARSRFLFSVQVATNAPGVAAILATLTEADSVPTQPTAPAAPTTPEPVQQVVEPTVPETQPEVAYEAPEAQESAVDDELLTFPSQILAPGSINAQNTPSEDTIEQFKEFIQEGMGLTEKSDLAKVGKLLAQTFGKSYNKAQNIPEDMLLDFIDFYVAAGDDNFKRVLATF